MGRLEIALLGAPTVRHDGRALTFPTRKALALLVYLAVEDGLHSRQKLAELFWPASDDQHRRGMLRYTIAALRRALGHAHDQQHLIASRDLIGIDAMSDLASDFHAVRAARTRGPAAATDVQSSRPGRDEIIALRQISASYRGEALEGLSLPDAPAFDDWADRQREVLRQGLDRVFDRLSELEADAGELADAMRSVERWLAVNPLSEEAHRRSMRLHLGAGDRAAALRAYQTCRALLAKELDASPAPETEALAEQIRIGTAARSVPRRQPAPSIQPGYVEAPLVGRSDQFTSLVEQFHAARRGDVQVVLLEGDPGIGKTRLADEFLGWAAGQGADILHGRAFETGGRLPYQPLVDALRPRVERENAPEDLLSDVWLSELGRLLPELRDRYPDLPVPAGDEGAARTRLFESITRLVQALAERAPTVLFVDDLQWSDSGSLDVLLYAGRRWRESRTPLLLLVSSRSESLAATPNLSEWLAGLRRNVEVTRLELGPLTQGDMSRLVRGLWAGDHGSGQDAESELEAFAGWLFKETEGQPLFAVEIIRTLIERGTLTLRPRDGGGWAIELPLGLEGRLTLGGILPPGVQDVIRERLQRLDPVARDLLTAGSVLGQGFTFDQLRQVAGLAEDDALRAADEALRSHLLREAPPDDWQFSAGTYLFAHDKIRESVYAEASEARRRIFHRRALDASPAVAAAHLARHALAAGLDEPAIRFSLDAGDEAMRLLAGRDAIDHYQRALLIANRLGRGDLCAELHARRGRAFASVARWTEARRDLEAALDVIGTDQRERRAEVQVDLLEACWWLLDMSGLRRVAGEVLGSAGELGRGELETAATGWLAASVGADGDVAGCVARCRRALLRSRELGTPAPPQVHTYISLSLYWLGKLDEAIERSREGVKAARAGNHLSAMMWCLPHLGIALAASGRYAEAVRTFQEARQLGRECGTTALLARAMAMSAGFHLDLEDFARHEAVAEEARELARSQEFAPPAVSAGIDLLLNFARRRDVGLAEQLLGEVAGAAEATAGFHGWLWSLRLAEARAEIALAREAWDEALMWADRAVAQSRARRRAKYHALALSTRAQALSATGRTREAVADVRAAVALARPIGDPALFLRAAAGLLRIDGDDVLAADAGAAVRRIAAALPDDMRNRFVTSEPARAVAGSTSRGRGGSALD